MSVVGRILILDTLIRPHQTLNSYPVITMHIYFSKFEETVINMPYVTSNGQVKLCIVEKMSVAGLNKWDVLSFLLQIRYQEILLFLSVRIH